MRVPSRRARSSRVRCRPPKKVVEEQRFRIARRRLRSASGGTGSRVGVTAGELVDGADDHHGVQRSEKAALVFVLCAGGFSSRGIAIARGGESPVPVEPRLWARKEINAATARVHLISFLTRVVVVQYSIIVFF